MGKIGAKPGNKEKKRKINQVGVIPRLKSYSKISLNSREISRNIKKASIETRLFFVIQYAAQFASQTK